MCFPTAFCMVLFMSTLHVSDLFPCWFCSSFCLSSTLHFKTDHIFPFNFFLKCASSPFHSPWLQVLWEDEGKLNLLSLFPEVIIILTCIDAPFFYMSHSFFLICKKVPFFLLLIQLLLDIVSSGPGIYPVALVDYHISIQYLPGLLEWSLRTQAGNLNIWETNNFFSHSGNWGKRKTQVVSN